MQGKVISRNGSWGFIEPVDPTLEDIFYHKSALLDNRKRLIEGERVEFEIGERNGKPIALRVRVIVPLTIKDVLSGTPESGVRQ